MFFKILVLLGALLVENRFVLGDDDYCDPYRASDCEENHVCCNHQCVYGIDCSGRICNDLYSNSCSGLMCCDGVCQYSCEDHTMIPIIIVITAGVCFLVGVIVIIVCCIVRRRRRIPTGGYVVTQPQGQVHTEAYFNQATTYPTGLGYGQANPQYGYGAI